MSRITLGGSFAVPGRPVGAVLVAVRGLAERRDPARTLLADVLHHAGLATLLCALVGPGEADLDEDVERLAGRVAGGLAWLSGHPRLDGLPLGCVAEGAAAAPALVAGAHRAGAEVAALVVCGGRPDRAAAALARVQAPTLLVAGEHDAEALRSGRRALARIATRSELAVIERTGDPIADPGALGTVCALARGWFLDHLSPAS